MRKHAKGLLLALATIVSCSSYFVAEYSGVIDHGATELQQKVARFLGDLERGAANPEFYAEARGDIQKLRDVASLQRGNDPTVRSLDLIQSNLDKLEAMHAGGISAKEVDIARTLLDSQFRMLIQLENAKKRKEG